MTLFDTLTLFAKFAVIVTALIVFAAIWTEAAHRTGHAQRILGQHDPDDFDDYLEREARR